MPALRQTSSAVAPSSACFNMNAIYCSLNLLLFVPKTPRLTNAKPNQDFLKKTDQFIGSRSLRAAREGAAGQSRYQPGQAVIICAVVGGVGGQLCREATVGFAQGMIRHAGEQMV